VFQFRHPIVTPREMWIGARLKLDTTARAEKYYGAAYSSWAFLCCISLSWGGLFENSHINPRAHGSGARQLVGTWRLISRVVRLEDGTAVQDAGLGKTPTGYLIYDSSGHVAAQLMRVDCPMGIDCGIPGPTPSDNSQSVNRYDACLAPMP
jgi:Lipocalin-like domain